MNDPFTFLTGGNLVKLFAPDDSSKKRSKIFMYDIRYTFMHKYVNEFDYDALLRIVMESKIEADDIHLMWIFTICVMDMLFQSRIYWDCAFPDDPPIYGLSLMRKMSLKYGYILGNILEGSDWTMSISDILVRMDGVIIDQMNELLQMSYDMDYSTSYKWNLYRSPYLHLMKWTRKGFDDSRIMSRLKISDSKTLFGMIYFKEQDADDIKFKKDFMESILKIADISRKEFDLINFRESSMIWNISYNSSITLLHVNFNFDEFINQFTAHCKENLGNRFSKHNRSKIFE
jgi:hypothetical protein